MITYRFIVEDYEVTFNGTLQPSMSQFISRDATLYYDTMDSLTGTKSYEANVGPTTVSITILDQGLEMARIEGNLSKSHMPVKQRIHGTGTWMST